MQQQFCRPLSVVRQLSTGVALSFTQLPVKMKMEASAAADLWKTVKAVAFDVDSTVCTDEGIDKLAVYCNVADEVAEWWVDGHCP